MIVLAVHTSTYVQSRNIYITNKQTDFIIMNKDQTPMSKSGMKTNLPPQEKGPVAAHGSNIWLLEVC